MKIETFEDNSGDMLITLNEQDIVAAIKAYISATESKIDPQFTVETMRSHRSIPNEFYFSKTGKEYSERKS